MSNQNTEAVSGVSAGQPSTVAQANAVTTDVTTQGAAASSNPDQVKMSDTISSLDELKKKAPQVYKQMMLGIAMNICSEMQHHQERLKEAIRDSRSA